MFENILQKQTDELKRFQEREEASFGFLKATEDRKRDEERKQVRY